MRMSNLVGTEGDAAMDAALNNLGMWSEGLAQGHTDEPCARCELAEAPVVCNIMAPSATYDDGLCGTCRDANDVLILAWPDEAQRLVDRVERLFPGMTGGQILAMAANLLSQMWSS
jgi:hypothetical protein